MLEVRGHVLTGQEQPNKSSSPQNSVGHVYRIQTIKLVSALNSKATQPSPLEEVSVWLVSLWRAVRLSSFLIFEKKGRGLVN